MPRARLKSVLKPRVKLYRLEWDSKSSVWYINVIYVRREAAAFVTRAQSTDKPPYRKTEGAAFRAGLPYMKRDLALLTTCLASARKSYRRLRKSYAVGQRADARVVR